ncbi:MAG: hypothetical protein GQE15_04320 [Archangiaceae bacterium]|nr:hypothetical protein [Archangiaceae bacterium]
MTIHAATRILRETARSDGRTNVEFELVCGCVITRTLDEHRLITAEDGVRLVIGKYPCPVGHPVRRPDARE